MTSVATNVFQTSTTTTLKIDIDDISADFISSNILRVNFTIKNTGTTTAKNVVAGAIRVDDEQLDSLLELLESPSGVEQLLEDDVLCLDKKIIGDIPAGGYATASLSYVTDDLENCFVMKVAVADNADGVFV
ncbi:MAG: hypothetical protein JW737_03235 [Acidobacteria bacterium]|nr:hypothetical protein [Acidobacteriota bacterium]